MSEEICSICHNNIENDKNIVITECNHKFHFSCLYKNIKQNTSTGNKCPLCRSYFDKNHINVIASWQTQTGNIYINNRYWNYSWRHTNNIFNTIQTNRSFINRRARIRNSRNRRTQNISSNTVISNRIDSSTTLSHARSLLRERRLRERLSKLSFKELKDEMKSHNISRRGYIRDSLERRLMTHLLRNSI